MAPNERRRISNLQRAIAFWAALAIAGAVGALPATGPSPLPPDRAEAFRFLPASSGSEAPLDGQLEVRFTGRRLSRTIVRCLLALAAGFAQRDEHGYYNLGLSGEVRRGDLAVERFAYRFDVPARAEAVDRLDLAFDRDLRPGRYRLHLELEDLQTGRRFSGDDELEVPEVALAAEAAVGAAGAAPAAGPLPSIELVLPDVPSLSGLHRVAAVASGGLVPARVRFLLDGAPVFTKSRPPFGVELDFGAEAEVRRVAVEACDAAGNVLARDERVVNAGAEPFALEIELPNAAIAGAGVAAARARLGVPRGRTVTRLDYFLGDAHAVTLEHAPFDRTVLLATGEATTVVRAVARLSDGRTAEDTALLNAPDVVDETSVRLVELYVAVVDRRGRNVEGLAAHDFRIVEDGRPQRIARFERVADLPLHLALVLDVSASMRPQLPQVARAATGFVRGAVTAADRASLITFNGAPRVAVDFTGDFGRLANGLSVLRASGRTEINRALELALRELESVAGQRAILLFSDGVESSPRDARALVEYARRGGVTIYTVGFGIPAEADEARALLGQLALETGGRTLFVDDVDELEGAYAAIVREMRSRYLVAFQSDNPDGEGFRTVDIELARRGLEVRAPRGYYP